MKLKICHLYPETLNLYGDRGNVLCMKKRLEWRGIDCEVDTLSIGETKDLEGYDLFFMGGGQDFEQEVLLRDLDGQNGREIHRAIHNGKTFLCICGGYQILGSHYETKEGIRCAFLGAIDLYTVGGEKRLIGNYAYRMRQDREECIVVGFENHSGRTYLGSGVRPLGTVLSGYGNNGKDHTEGVHFKNVFGTYSHGPVLPKNPGFCDCILKTALEYKYPGAVLTPLEDRFEKKAHDAVLEQVLGKGKKRRALTWQK